MTDNDGQNQFDGAIDSKFLDEGDEMLSWMPDVGNI